MIISKKIMDLELYLNLINKCASNEELAEIKTLLFGKKGVMSNALHSLSKLSVEEKKTIGKQLNDYKEILYKSMMTRQNELEMQQWQKRLADETIDVTLPSIKRSEGRLHPIMQTMSEIIEIFSALGFEIRQGPDIETEFYNFDALNVPADHPARGDHDTFFLEESNHILRTHTSPVQIRIMMKEQPPLRMLTPGRVYRADHDRTHSPMFHQIEGLVIEENITMSHLKGCLETFLTYFFNRKIQTRFRPSFFPFTEPSAELDIAYGQHNESLDIMNGENWLEVLGCGMVHQNVFEKCNLDPKRYQGFAFGMGVERMAMLKYGITDLRTFYQNDQRWLYHYGAFAARM